MPVLHLEWSPEKFFQDIVEKDMLQSRQTLPVWVGELYLELHQGTLTSQGRLKKLNRVCEHRMRALEALLVHALHWEAVSLEDACSFHQQLTKLWKDILLNQFHDVLRKISLSIYLCFHLLFVVLCNCSLFVISWILHRDGL